MTRRKWIWAAMVAAPLAITGGVVYASVATPKATGYTCPITGEQLQCSECCPLNGEQAATETSAADKPRAEAYVCPLTGETLNCRKCCPLDDAK